MSKRVLITGGSGFIGSHLVDECLGRGWEVLSIDLVGMMSANRKLHCREDDVRSKATVLLKRHADYFAKPVDYVFHLAAEPFIPKSYTDPATFIHTNVCGTLNILELSQLIGARRVLVVSTSEVYGRVDHGTAILESAPLRPLSTYGATKLAADRLAIARYCESHVPVIVLRPFNAYGPRASQPYVIPEIVSQASRGNVVRLGNIDSVRDFSYVTDTAWAMAEIIEKGELGEVYHYGSGEARTVRDIANSIMEVMDKGFSIEIEQSRLRPADVTWLLACNSKFESAVGRQRPRVSLESGLRRMIDWFIANGERWPYETQPEAATSC